MNKIKTVVSPFCLLLLGMGIILLGAWDNHQASASSIQDTWLLATSLPEPLAANLVRCADVPGSFYMIGGMVSGNITTDQLIRYDIFLAKWNLTLETLPAPRRAVAAACYQGRIYVAGGMDQFFNIRDTLFIYDIETDTWTMGPNMPHWIWGAAMGAWDGKLYVVGGNQAGDPYETPIDHVDVFDLTLWEWTEGGGRPMQTAASFFGSVQTGPYLYAVGGFSGDFAHNVDQTQRYNMATDEWQSGPQFTSARALGELAITSSHLYMLGGDQDGGTEYDETDLVEVLDLSTWPDGIWTVLNDLLPELNIYPATACSEVLTGGEIWAIGGGMIDQDIILYDTNLYHPIGEPCVSYGVDLPEPWQGAGKFGTTVEYTLTITNTGSITDYYTLAVSTIWETAAPLGGPGPIGPGESLQVALAVEVPADAMWGDQGLTEITASSISNPAAFDTTTITTTVLGYQVQVTPISPDSQAGHPGEVLTYTVLVSNIGDFEDSYTVDISTTWATITPIDIGPLLPDESSEMIIVVEIPSDALHGDWDEAWITLTSQDDPRASTTIRLTSTAVWHRMLIPLTLKN